MLRINGKTVQLAGGNVSCGDHHGAGDPTVSVNGLGIALVGQLTIGHGGFPPTPAIEGETSVKVNGIPIVVFGDHYLPHTNGLIIHGPITAS